MIFLRNITSPFYVAISCQLVLNEVGLEDVKRELAEIKQRLDDQEESSATGHTSTDPALVDKILNLEKKNAEMSARLATVSTICHSISTDLVIGGLSVLAGCDMKALVTAVLAIVYPGIATFRDVVEVRPLISKAARDKVASSAATTDSTGTTQPPSNPSTATPILGSPRPPSLLVTVTSRALLEAILRGKTKLGKLHTMALTATLPAGINSDSITPALININEFLSSDVFKLHRLVRQKAKQSEAGLTTFIRGGHIFVRRKKGDTATLIASEEDLNRFLAL